MIVVTVRSLVEKGLWAKACEVVGDSLLVDTITNELDYEDEIELTNIQAIKIGLIKESDVQ